MFDTGLSCAAARNSHDSELLADVYRQLATQGDKSRLAQQPSEDTSLVHLAQPVTRSVSHSNLRKKVVAVVMASVAVAVTLAVIWNSDFSANESWPHTTKNTRRDSEPEPEGDHQLEDHHLADHVSKSGTESIITAGSKFLLLDPTQPTHATTHKQAGFTDNPRPATSLAQRILHDLVHNKNETAQVQKAEQTAESAMVREMLGSQPPSPKEQHTARPKAGRTAARRERYLQHKAAATQQLLLDTKSLIHLRNIIRHRTAMAHQIELNTVLEETVLEEDLAPTVQK